MGRLPWATPEQLEFLYSKVPDLARAKATSGLKLFYASVSKEFRVKWKLEPVVSTDPTLSLEGLNNEAKPQLEDVRVLF